MILESFTIFVLQRSKTMDDKMKYVLCLEAILTKKEGSCIVIISCNY